jgi:hypothetical protein
MILTGLYPERGEKMTHRWVAIWRARSAFVHQTLPMSVESDSKVAAQAYALANPPVWQA